MPGGLDIRKGPAPCDPEDLPPEGGNGTGHWLWPAWTWHLAIAPMPLTQVRMARNIRHTCPHPAKTDERQETPGCPAWDMTLHVPPWTESHLPFFSVYQKSLALSSKSLGSKGTGNGEVKQGRGKSLWGEGQEKRHLGH